MPFKRRSQKPRKPPIGSENGVRPPSGERQTMAEATQMATVAEVGGLLRVGRKHVYRLIDQGKLRAIRLAGKKGPYRIFASSVERFLGVKQTTASTRADERAELRELHAAAARLGVEA